MGKRREVPPNLNIILRYPSGIKDDEDGQKFIRHLNLWFLATDPIIIDSDESPTEIKIKSTDILREVFICIAGKWITDLFSNPDPTKPKSIISLDQNHYSMSISTPTTVYCGIFPITNTQDEEGYFTFACRGKMKL